MNHKECGKLFKAAKALMEKSHLVKYEGGQFTVRHDNSDAFDKCVRTAFGEEHGRYIAWVLFSVGAENLVKAACVCSKVVQEDPQYGNYGMMGDYLRRNNRTGKYEGHLVKLCCSMKLCPPDCQKLKEGYESLKDVRNRDIHSFVRNVRVANYPSVKDQFAPAFNVLVRAMEKKGHLV